jgi:hypothetical protein
MSGHDRYQQILRRLQPLRQSLLEHSIYGQIDSLNNLQLFMQHHVFAVWDFMSLLKTLQQQLCHVGVPWLPPEDVTAARFVNEIVLGEESDEDGQGGFASHFELYRRGMQRCGASTACIDRFVHDVRRGQTVAKALQNEDIPETVRQFVQQTFAVIEQDDLCAVASAFTFGREDLLPDVFQRIVDELNVKSGGGLDDFRYYLARHIELDGDHHGPMAARLITSLCGDDEAKWRSAEEAAVESLQARVTLWDGMEAIIGFASEAKAS